MSRRQSFTSRRRRELQKRVDRLETLEIRNTITEPISVLGLSLSALRGLASVGLIDLSGSGDALRRLQAAAESMRQGQAWGAQPTAVRSEVLSSASAFAPVVARSRSQPASGTAAAAAPAPGT